MGAARRGRLLALGPVRIWAVRLGVWPTGWDDYSIDIAEQRVEVDGVRQPLDLRVAVPGIHQSIELSQGARDLALP